MNIRRMVSCRIESRCARAFLLTLTLVFVSVAGSASPAAAHAQLVTTSPSNDSVVNGAPPVVSVTFDESVSVAPNGIRIFDAVGDRIQTGDARQASSSSVIELPVPEGLANGAYVVTWRAISSDSHPINGAFTFGIGTSTQADSAVIEDLISSDESNGLVSALLTGARAIGFAAMLMLVGAAGFVVLVDRSVSRHRLFVRSIRISGVAGVIATAAAIGLQQLYVDARQIGDIVSGAVLGDAVSSRFGLLGLSRMALFVVLGLLVGKLAGRAAPLRSGRVAMVVMSVALVATVTLGGHAVSGRWVAVAIPVDVVHVLAAAVWLGGLVLVLGVLVKSNSNTDPLERFSKVAFASVCVLVVTGTIQSIRQVESLEGVLDTSYGQVLVAKVALVALMILVAAGSRRWVQHRRTSSESVDISDLAKRVKIEAFGGLAVIILTAVLVNVSPVSAATNGPETLSLDAGRVTFEVTVDPARRGPAVVHVYALSPRGLAVDVQSMAASISLPSKQIADVPIELQRLSTGHYSANTNLPIKGDWELSVTAAVDDFTQLNATGELKVR